MNSPSPKLYEIARAAAVSSSLRHCLTREQAEAQKQLRSEFGVGNLSDGICVPWFERTGRPDVEFDVAGRNGGRLTIRSETRAMSATGQTSVAGDQGGMTIATDVPDIGAAFRDNLVLERLGARVFGGLRGNANFPRGKVAITASWLSENAPAGNTSETFEMLAMKPQRLTASLPVSDELLMQGAGIEGHLRFELMAALAVACQQALVNGAGSGSNQPLGILNTPGIGSVVGGTNGASATYANLCALEYAVTGTGKADRGNTGWLVSPAVRFTLRQTPINALISRPIWSEREAASLLGHPAGVTPSVPETLTKGTSVGNCTAIIFGEWSELFLATWGPGVIIGAVRDSTNFVQGQTLLYATIYFNGGVRGAPAFAAMSDVLYSTT